MTPNDSTGTGREKRAPTEGDVHAVLSNDRRHRLIEQLANRRGPTPMRDVSEAIASAEGGESPAPKRLRDSVYASLHQTHVPKLEELDIVNYDRDDRTVSLRPEARYVSLYTGPIGFGGVPRVHLALAGLLALASLVIGSAFGLPIVSLVGPPAWAFAAIVGVVGYVAYVLVRRPWPQAWQFRHLVDVLRGRSS